MFRLQTCTPLENQGHRLGAHLHSGDSKEARLTNLHKMLNWDIRANALKPCSAAAMDEKQQLQYCYSKVPWSPWKIDELILNVQQAERQT